MEAIRFTNTSVDEIRIDDSSRYPPDESQEDDASRQYQVDSDVSYYIIPHGCPPDLINTEGTHEQNIQNDQMITQPTNISLGNNIEVSGSITESLVPDDRWSKHQHIELVNIIGDPGKGMLTRSMAAKLTASLASECLFADFLSEIEPKKVWTLVPLPYGKTAIGSKWVSRNKKDEHVYQMDVKSAFLNGKIKEEVYVKQPPDFKSSEFPDYVYKLDKALYGLKQAPRVWYETLSTFLIQNKFTMGRIDNTLFIYKSKGDILLVQVYVYDIIFGLTSYKLCKQFEKLMTKKFEMSMIGELTYFLRQQIKQDDKGISICQE
ncbi:retrovirus-related pol polyprotein from transposon TNT 1-94 [Tanacetum coccineum]